MNFIEFLGVSYLNEMARTIRPEITGLSKSIWIGDTKRSARP